MQRTRPHEAGLAALSIRLVLQPERQRWTSKAGVNRPRAATQVSRSPGLWLLGAHSAAPTGDHHLTSATGLRVPAREIEKLVLDQLWGFLADPLDVVTAASFELPVEQVGALHRRYVAFHGRLHERSSAALSATLQ